MQFLYRDQHDIWLIMQGVMQAMASFSFLLPSRAIYMEVVGRKRKRNFIIVINGIILKKLSEMIG